MNNVEVFPEPTLEIGTAKFFDIRISERAKGMIGAWKDALEEDGLPMSFSAALEDMCSYATDAYLAEDAEEEA